MSRRADGLAKALCFLRDLCGRQSTSATGASLPPLRLLARRAGVSTFTLSKAVGVLTREGVVSVVPRKGIWLKGQAPVPSTTTPSASGSPAKWQRVKEGIERELLSVGPGHEDRVRSLKEYAGRYGVCYATVKKAMRALVAEGIVVEGNGRYAGARPREGRPTASLVLITFGRLESIPHFVNERDHVFLHRVEMLCSMHNVKLIVHVVPEARNDDAGVERALDDVRRLETQGPVLGYIVLTSLLHRSVYLIGRLARLGKPVAAYDEWGVLEGEGLRVLPGNVRVFLVSHTMAPGAGAARYLLAMGHRAVMYVSVYENERWSVNRLTGMREVYRRAGLEQAVSACMVDSLRSADGAVEKAHAYDRRIAVDYCRRNGYGTTGVLGRILHEGISSIGTRELQRRLLWPHVARAIAAGGVTAIAADNDWTAAIVMDSCTEEGIRIPERFSLMGFDNLSESRIRNMTSLDFDVSGVADASVHHILKAGPGRGRMLKGPAHGEASRGMIIERGTTRPPPSTRSGTQAGGAKIR